jgi:hypothetical protein
MGEADVDDRVIDEALLIVRRLWDAGLAHRDIKPANLLVRDGPLVRDDPLARVDRVLLIDVFFVQVRPSAWRQAVDLANMMLVLAVRTDAERVYRRALVYFTPDDIAEAFAATRGVASPTQLRSVMKQDGRNLVEEFRALGTERRRVALQRWSLRRLLLALAAAVGCLFVIFQLLLLVRPAHDLTIVQSPDCGTSHLLVLMAQAVPSATLVPCLSALPGGWTLGGTSVHRGEAKFWLHSDKAGQRAVEVTLLPPDRCVVKGAAAVPSEQAGARRYEFAEQSPPELRSSRYYVFDGGCVTYQFAFARAATPSMSFTIGQALAFQPRPTLVEAVRRSAGLALCGAGAPCEGGEGR